MQHLPHPHPTASAHSEKLRQHIRQQIASSSDLLSFDRFMDLCLYAPALGYYSTGHQKFGIGGDFITAPQLSPLFSQCIARQTQQILQQISQGNILEFGAGNGAMACDILLYLAQHDSLPAHYFILEISPDLQQRQQQLLQQRCPDLATRVIWLQQLPTNFNGVILANEVFDAMPVQRFARINNKIQQYFVTEKNQQFAWQLDEPSDELVQRVSNLQQHFSTANNYTSEISCLISSWIKTIAAQLTKGVLLIIDYGFSEREYYHPQRNSGTLMCHYQHRAHDNPLILPGLQDITAHIDFSLVANAAAENNLEVLGFCTQAFFLLSCGILDLIPKNPRDHIRANQAIKQLTLPHEMGELFKVMALGRDIDTSLIGFSMQDLRERL